MLEHAVGPGAPDQSHVSASRAAEAANHPVVIAAHAIGHPQTIFTNLRRAGRIRCATAVRRCPARSLCLPACGYRAVDRRGIRVKAGAHPIEQPGSDDEDRRSARIRARRVREAGKAMFAHASGEPQRSTKLTFGRLWPARAVRLEPCAGAVGGLKRGGPRVDPRPKLEPAPSRRGIGEVRHPMGAHALRQPECQACTSGRRAGLARRSACCEQHPARDCGELVSRTVGSHTCLAHA